MSEVEVIVGESPIDPSAEAAKLSAGADNDCGAIAMFCGVVRGGEVTAMTLEHYPEMTKSALYEIASTAAKKWELKTARIIHRTGRMTPGEVIVFVGASSPHRSSAFSACSYMTDYLKTRAPFWKKEETSSGSRWVEAKPEDEEARRRWE